MHLISRAMEGVISQLKDTHQNRVRTALQAPYVSEWLLARDLHVLAIHAQLSGMVSCPEDWRLLEPEDIEQLVVLPGLNKAQQTRFRTAVSEACGCSAPQPAPVQIAPPVVEIVEVKCLQQRIMVIKQRCDRLSIRRLFLLPPADRLW